MFWKIIAGFIGFFSVTMVALYQPAVAQTASPTPAPTGKLCPIALTPGVAVDTVSNSIMLHIRNQGCQPGDTLIAQNWSYDRRQAHHYIKAFCVAGSVSHLMMNGTAMSFACMLPYKRAGFYDN